MVTDTRFSVKAEDVDNIITTDENLLSSVVANTNDMIFCREYNAIVLTDSKYILRDIYPNTYQTMTTVPDKLDASNFTTTGGMFFDCLAIKSIPQLDTSKITNMSYMFTYCLKLPTVFPWTIDCTYIDSIDNIRKIFNWPSVKEVTFKNVNEDIKPQFTAANLGSQLTKINFV